MKVTINIKDSNYLLALAELVRQDEDAKPKRAVVVESEKASGESRQNNDSGISLPTATIAGGDRERAVII